MINFQIMCNVDENFCTEELKPSNLYTFKDEKLLSRESNLKIDLQKASKKYKIFCIL